MSFCSEIWSSAELNNKIPDKIIFSNLHSKGQPIALRPAKPEFRVYDPTHYHYLPGNIVLSKKEIIAPHKTGPGQLINKAPLTNVGKRIEAKKERDRDVVVVVNLCAACAPKIIELIYQQLDKWQMSCVKITSVCHCVIFTFYTLSVSLLIIIL